MNWTISETTDYSVIIDDRGKVLAQMANREQAARIVKTHNETVKFLASINVENARL